MPRPTLVTGAAGFAGSHLLDLLGPQGIDIVAWHRPGGSPTATASSIRWQAVDVLDRDAVRAAIQDLQPQAVYHCAGAAHVGEAWNAATTTLATNVMGTHHLIETLRDFTPDAHVLNTSSALVYSPSAAPLDEQHPLVPASPYGLSKLAQEMASGGNPDGPFVHVARPFNHLGPRQSPSFARSATSNRFAI